MILCLTFADSSVPVFLLTKMKLWQNLINKGAKIFAGEVFAGGALAGGLGGAAALAHDAVVRRAGRLIDYLTLHSYGISDPRRRRRLRRPPLRTHGRGTPASGVRAASGVCNLN
ncbi:MAG: hypothetical protein LBS59_07935 [Puniceicoccales bacterium]|nr:hypothetical protein [Puniceicoccales bacterium]